MARRCVPAIDPHFGEDRFHPTQKLLLKAAGDRGLSAALSESSPPVPSEVRNKNEFAAKFFVGLLPHLQEIGLRHNVLISQIAVSVFQFGM